jgi:hypothetical protein
MRPIRQVGDGRGVLLGGGENRAPPGTHILGGVIGRGELFEPGVDVLCGRSSFLSAPGVDGSRSVGGVGRHILASRARPVIRL